MHKSRLAGFIIDCRTGDLNSAAEFWGRALGAKKVERVNTWWVMEAPTGQRFCVVKAESPTFAAEAQTFE